MNKAITLILSRYGRALEYFSDEKHWGIDSLRGLEIRAPFSSRIDSNKGSSIDTHLLTWVRFALETCVAATLPDLAPSGNLLRLITSGDTLTFARAPTASPTSNGMNCKGRDFDLNARGLILGDSSTH